MFLKNLRSLKKTIGFKITAWYTFIFSLSALSLFMMAYVFLYSTLNQKNYNEILLKLDEISTLFQIGGIKIVENYIIENNTSRRSNPLFVRVATISNKTFIVLHQNNFKILTFQYLKELH